MNIKLTKLHAIQSQTISKFTGNISNSTSKSTSKTNQNQVRGAMGGAYPLYASLSQAVSPPRGTRGTRGLSTVRPVRLWKVSAHETTMRPVETSGGK